MKYNFNEGDIVYLDQAKLKLIENPKISSHFEQIGHLFGIVKCIVLEDKSKTMEAGYTSDFNCDFLRK